MPSDFSFTLTMVAARDSSIIGTLRGVGGGGVGGLNARNKDLIRPPTPREDRA